MNPEFTAYLILILIASAMSLFVLAGLYPEKVPFLVKYYEEHEN